MKLVMLVMFMVLGCKGKDSGGGQPAPGSAAGSATPGAATAGAAATPPEADKQDDRCAAPCRFLADTPLAEVAAKVKAACGAEWAASTADCAQLDFQRNCVYATAGYAFTKEHYQTAFGKEPWYKARADFKEKDLSPVALANIRELKLQAKACRASAPVSEADKKVVEAWLAKLQAGKPELPGLLYLSGDDDDKASVAKQLVAQKDSFRAQRMRSLAYRDAAISTSVTAGLKGKSVRFVEADFSEPASPDCKDEDDSEGCEGSGLYLLFAIDDKGKIVALEQMVAACPFAYLVTDAGPVLQGELLRNLVSHVRETSQHLRVQVPRCSGQVTFRITEEKREVTRLDALALVVDGATILPDTCGALCGNDGVAHVLAQGDALDVTFTLPAGARCERATLRANGFYDLLPR